jgi:hypothetical protein
VLDTKPKLLSYLEEIVVLKPSSGPAASALNWPDT